ncbi:cation:proton antiporter domain-containing protein [Rhodococcus zopfii]|uniref:cation:proton antiporter domain-containing protein n=1 Tax=Rhodococcus zopfii TaxID=43772 RepID=UPI000AF37609|nr:cation:proton antiporter [Rhodococcus zopfii]
MSTFVVVGLCVGIVCALGARGIARLGLAAPLVMVVAGIAVSSAMDEDLTDLLNASATEHVVELILALLLFVDATEVRKGLFGGEQTIAIRLLAGALPLSLFVAIVVGSALLPATAVATIVVIACVVMPTDMAPASTLLNDGRLPPRVRSVLNVESGYNDGIVAPIFVVALALLGDDHTGESVGTAILHGLQSSLVAGLVGIAVGFGGALAARTLTDRALTTTRGIRIGVALIPLLAYAAAGVLFANGFIAAFVCGIAYHATRNAGVTAHSELELTEDLATLSSMAMWFLFGATVSYLAEIGLPGWEVFVFVAAALTVLRIVPIRLFLLGSDLPTRDRRAIALLGPRGTASIVFGLLAWRGISDLDDASLVLYVMAATVLGSIAFHGFAANRTAAGYARAIPPSPRS